MEWGFFPYLAERLSQRGMTVIRFNLSGSGMRPGEDWVADPEAFRTATYTKDLSELCEILSAVGSTIAPEHVDRDALGLLGHSRGGGTSILASSLCAVRDRLRALVTWSAISTIERLSAQEIEAWQERGAFPVVNTRTGQELELGVEVLEDALRHREELNVERAASERAMPWLIVHGDADETVPVAEGGRLAAMARSPVEFLRISGTGHTFGATQPFSGTTVPLEQAVDATVAWFEKHLG